MVALFTFNLYTFFRIPIKHYISFANFKAKNIITVIIHTLTSLYIRNYTVSRFEEAKFMHSFASEIKTNKTERSERLIGMKNSKSINFMQLKLPASLLALSANYATDEERRST